MIPLPELNFYNCMWSVFVALKGKCNNSNKISKKVFIVEWRCKHMWKEKKMKKPFHASMQFVRAFALNICFLSVTHIFQPININDLQIPERNMLLSFSENYCDVIFIMWKYNRRVIFTSNHILIIFRHWFRYFHFQFFTYKYSIE